MEKEYISKDMIPDGYVVGQNRAVKDRSYSHLYKGTFGNPGFPMCRYGWNRDKGTAYSIWRGNVGGRGICPTCYKRAIQGLDGVEPKDHTQPTSEKGV